MDKYDEKANELVTACYAKDGRTAQANIIATALREAAADEAKFAADSLYQAAMDLTGMPVVRDTLLTAVKQFEARAAAIREASR